MTVTVAIAAETAMIAAEQKYDQDNEYDNS
jgi:hypothetical protein